MGTYGLNATPGDCWSGMCQEIGPFVGFRSSIDSGQTWSEPCATDGTKLTVASPLFETLGDPVKLGVRACGDFDVYFVHHFSDV